MMTSWIRQRQPGIDDAASAPADPEAIQVGSTDISME